MRLIGSPGAKVGLRSASRRVQRVSRRSHVRVQAIGFDPPRQSRKTLTNMGTVAASLLVASPVMKSGAVSEAFLACLTATQKFQASSKDILAAYSKFYNLLISAGYESWSDYVLDQLLMGRDNPVARSIAQGNLDDGAPILAALAHDLDLLQVLAIELHQLAEYVGESAPFGGAEWIAAGSDPSFKGKSKRLGNGSASPVSALNMSTQSKFITRPPTPDELTQWKELISSKELWSQALPVVRQYWHQHGFGITSRNTTLRWVKGALEEAPDRDAPATPSAAPSTASATPTAPLSVLEPIRAALVTNTQRHLDGRTASHVLLAGPSGSGKSWLLWDSVLEEGRERGLRLVDLNGADGATILEAARGCGRYPRLRFVLVADHVDLPLRGNGAAELMAGLSNVGPGGWPSNTLLYLGATANSTVSVDPIVGRFGTLLFTKPLSEEQFRTSLVEMVTQRVEAANFDGAAARSARSVKSRELVQVPESELEAAVNWAKSLGSGFSVRAAAQYLDKYFEV